MLSGTGAKRTGTSRRLRQAMKLQQSNAAATIGPNRWNSKARCKSPVRAAEVALVRKHPGPGIPVRARKGQPQPGACG